MKTKYMSRLAYRQIYKFGYHKLLQESISCAVKSNFNHNIVVANFVVFVIYFWVCIIFTHWLGKKSIGQRLGLVKKKISNRVCGPKSLGNTGLEIYWWALNFLNVRSSHEFFYIIIMLGIYN